MFRRSDPSSPRYGQHYSKDDVVELFSPDESSVTAIKEWLISSGVSPNAITSPQSRGWVDFSTTVDQLESLMKTKYHMYDHVEARSAHLGADEYHLPRDISHLVDFVTPGVVMARSSQPAQRFKRLIGGILPPLQPIPEQISRILAADPSKSACQMNKEPNVVPSWLCNKV